MEVYVRQAKSTIKFNLPDSSDPSVAQATATALGKMTVGANPCQKAGIKPSPPPKTKPPPPMNFRYHCKRSLVAAECTRLHFNFTKVQNTKSGIKIIVAFIGDFRNLNRYLIQNNLFFKTFAFEEERKIKTVIKGISTELDLDYMKEDLLRQGYPIPAVHRLYRRDNIALGMVLAILERSDRAKEIFKELGNICGFSSILVEAPHK
ncbi:hypothetical protein EVAR_99474_1 [Eumeta japonica]|uniref:Pre-C2HC domain-containing protein n=1 Tax=Eumeta variegata TaxID=151549 RepID=A0A4C1ZPH2_EUMVA|nr:hypothetical protein EVAR_99474_1 [Eumeta japonica]